MHQKTLFRGLAVMVVALIAVVFVTALARRKSKESSPMQDLSGAVGFSLFSTLPTDLSYASISTHLSPIHRRSGPAV